MSESVTEFTMYFILYVQGYTSNLANSYTFCLHILIAHRIYKCDTQTFDDVKKAHFRAEAHCNSIRYVYIYMLLLHKFKILFCIFLSLHIAVFIHSNIFVCIV